MLKRSLMVMAFVVAGSLVGLALVGCGGDEDIESQDLEDNENTADYVVVARDFEFSIEEPEIGAGDFTLEFNNQGSTAHTFSIYRDADYTDLAETTGQVNGGVVQRFDMSLEAGNYFVRCDVHPTQMTATLVAQ